MFINQVLNNSYLPGLKQQADKVRWISSVLFHLQFSSVQLLSRVQLFPTPWIAAHQASLSITSSWSSLKLTSIESVMPSSHLILCRPLLLLPPIPPSIRVFSNESTLRMRWSKYWRFSFSIIPSKEYPGLIFFRIDWLDLLAVQVIVQHLLIQCLWLLYRKLSLFIVNKEIRLYESHFVYLFNQLMDIWVVSILGCYE